MARLARLHVPGSPQLVEHRARAGSAIAPTPGMRTELLDLIRHQTRSRAVVLHGYAVEPARFRLLLLAPTPGALAGALQAIARIQGNRTAERSGSRVDWDGRFRSAVIAPGADVLRVMLHLDRSDAEWALTSAAHHMGSGRDAALVDPPEYWKLGNTPYERQDAYRQRLASAAPVDEIEAMERALRGGWLFGGRGGVDPAIASRQLQPRPRGRPVKIHR